MHYGTAYIQAQHNALKAFKDLTRPQVMLLHTLACYKYPLKHCVIFNELSADYCVISPTTFQTALNTLVARNLLAKQVTGNNALYSITTDGRYSLAAFNATLDAIVKAHILKYGNGFIEH